MSFIDVLGDIGYGFNDAANAAYTRYQNMDKARTSDVAASRQEKQHDADTAYDMFNAQAGANRAKLDYMRNQNQLGANQVGDKLDYYDPETRAVVGKMVEQYGGADTPEFRRAYADYLAGKGMLQTADSEYQRAQRETAAGQQVASVLQKMPGFEEVHSVEMGEDGRIYGFKGQPDANGEYEVVDLPPAALRQYSALMGNTKPLGYDLKMQGAGVTNRAAAMGQFPQQGGQRQQAARAQAQARGQIGSLTQNQLISIWQSSTKQLMSEGMSREQAEAQTQEFLGRMGIQLPSGLGGQGSIDVPNVTGGGYTPGQFVRQMAQPRTSNSGYGGGGGGDYGGYGGGGYGGGGGDGGPPSWSTPPFVPQQQESPLGVNGFGMDAQQNSQPPFYNEMVQAIGPQVVASGRLPTYTVQLLRQRGFPIGAIQQFLQYNALMQKLP